MFRFYQSDASEDLAKFFAQLVRTLPLEDPFLAETVIVESPGLRVWLLNQLVQQNGIAANINLVSLSQFSRRLICEVSGRSSTSYPFTFERLQWRIFQLLPLLFETPSFLIHKATISKSEEACFYFAKQLASVFEAYLSDRLDWLDAWEKNQTIGLGRDEIWQAELWRLLSQEVIAPYHIGHLINSDFLSKAFLPKRLTLFCLASFPPAYWAFFKKLASYIDIYGFFFNPCAEYGWHLGDTKNLFANNGGIWQPLAGDLLLGQLGRKSAVFFNGFTSEEASTIKGLFQKKGRQSLLNWLQSNIVTPNISLNNAAATKMKGPCLLDQSICLHITHSPLRELEVLRDQLLTYFLEDPTLTPADITVLSPCLDRYYPFIPAIFGGSENENRIAYKIVHEDLIHADQILFLTLFKLLDLLDSRFTVKAVCDLLACEALCQNFNISPSEVGLFNALVKHAMIRWGRDASHRAEYGFFEEPASSWRLGLDRLLLGAILPSDLEEGKPSCFADLFPSDMKLRDLPKFAKLHNFFEALSAVAIECKEPTSPKNWSNRLINILDVFFKSNDSASMFQDAVRQSLLIFMDAHSDFQDRPFGLVVFRAWLKNHLKLPVRNDFLTGALTFSSMKSMEGVPFKRICLIGLDKESLPKPSLPASFDLIAQHMRRGDTTQRDDEAYLFLRSLLLAKQSLYLSWTGYSQCNDEVLPPSVFIERLVEALSILVNIDDPQKVLKSLCTSHPMHLFYTREGGGESLRRACTNPYSISVRRGNLPLLKKESKTAAIRVSFDQFSSFWRLPVKVWLSEKLEAKYGYYKNEMIETEPLLVDGHTKSRLYRQLFEDLSEKRFLEKNQLALSSFLPPGALGNIWFQNLSADIQKIVLPDGIFERSIPVLRYEIKCGEDYLIGFLREVKPRGIFYFMPSTSNIFFIILAWLKHLVINSVHESNFYPRTTLICLKDNYRFDPLIQTQAKAYLESWMRWYKTGQEVPLAFFLRTGFKAACEVASGKTRQEAWVKAQKAWFSDYLFAGEAHEMSTKLVFDTCDLLKEAQFWEMVESLLVPCAKMLIDQGYAK